MNPFTYSHATAVDDAVRDKASHPDAAYIGGGTNLLDLMKENVERPTHLIGLNRLPLAKIQNNPEGGLRLGALATNADTAWHPEVEKRYPLLSQAILAGASPQLRNMATNGGNLMQRTRCYYFYDTATPCNKREPGSGCSAIGGYNRIHAILGTSQSCIATHPSDMCIALAALEAVVRVSGPNGERTIDFTDFHRLPGNAPHIDNTLRPGELITGLDLPAKGFEKNYSYLKLRDRTSYAFALVSVAAALELDGNTIKEARLALGGVAHKPWRDTDVEDSLKGQPATAETFRKAATQLLQGARGFGSNDFKVELAKRAIVRALKQATEMKQGPTDVFLNSNP
ncbi:xanthine dehydrogenase family protein subunit M [Hymenobacter taeanensis]|uniref:Xanthine dehydrogenase family protein subunit M n=1 Tax=Hymenobacter taeanensis TaxID=2735321 RepID=A0A6M6BLH3_9BACT|nr:MULTISPECIES: xanthine dehydrogenase family protein subunit M [Hymenobacter]QJX48986.1 xanthine dehydrogenase family protein subunit M [Hymenobacter taeanensis]UOQ81496.1 xanthine dehydrogenase family protein subunit M [Hymenobacter sp. 5414T-23]